MIPQIYIEKWNKTIAPWKSFGMVEQDLILSRALVELYSNPIISNALAFRGGTALNKLFIKPPARYSEDLDFVQIKAEPIGKTIDAIHSVLDSWLGAPKRKFTERSAKLTYRYESIDNTKAKLKIEINTTEHFQVAGIHDYAFNMSSEWFSGNTIIKSYALDELMATKLRALYQRRKGRDLFDLYYVLNKNLINPNNVLDIFKKYCEFNDELISRAEFEKSLFLKKKNADFKTDILPLLTTETHWNFDEAITLVESLLVRLLQGERWKGEENL